jgi:hypothetical protein
MFSRMAVVVTTLGLLPGLVSAQTSVLAAQPRIRITGPEEYEIPGVLKIAGSRVGGDGGQAKITIEETVVRVVSPATGQPMAVLRPKRRLVGRAMEVRDQIVEFLPDGQRDTLKIPLDSIGKLEVSERRSRFHVLRGILVGIGTFYGVAGLFFARCGLGCDGAILLPALAGGITTGILTGRGSDHWRSAPADWLLSQVNGSVDTASVPVGAPQLLPNPRLEPPLAAAP